MNNKKFFEDNTGNKSSMRLMSMMALVTAIILSILVALGDAQSKDTLLIIATFLTAAFAPKTVQKFAENKLTKVVKK